MPDLTYLPDARSHIGERIPEPLSRYLMAVACVVLPLAFYLLVLSPTVGYFVRDFEIVPDSIALISQDACLASAFKTVDGKPAAVMPAAAKELAFQAADGAGRFGFAIPSAFLTLIALLTVGYALRVISRRAGLRVLLLTGAAVVSAAFLLVDGIKYNGATHLKIGEQTQRVLVDAVLRKADTRQPSLSAQPPAATEMKSPSREKRVGRQVRWNLIFGIGGTLATLAGMGFVAIRARPEELRGAILRQRLFDMQYLIAAAAVILVLTVIITKGLVGWALGLVCPDQTGALEGIGAALGNYWGASASGVLLAALLPGHIAWSDDVQRFAEAEAPQASHAARVELIGKEGLDFHPATSLMTLASVATPALIGPFLEVLKPLIH